MHLTHLFHHLLHLEKFVEHTVQFGNFYARTGGDAFAATGVEDVWVATFLQGHRTNEGFHTAHFFLTFVEVRAFECLITAGEHTHDVLQWAHFFHRTHLLQEIF